MPKIAQYGSPKVTSVVSKQPMASNTPRGAFDQPLVKAAVSVTNSALNIKQRIDTVSAEEAISQFERAKNDLFFNPDSGYFNSQGRNAYDTSVSTLESVDELRVKYGESLSEQAKSMYDKVADQHLSRAQVDVQRHASKGFKAWEIATIDAQVEDSIETASLYWNDDERVAVQRAVGRQAVMDSAELSGIGSEALAEKLQTFESSFARAIIESAIASGSVHGEESISRYGDRLEGPYLTKLTSTLNEKKRVEKITSDAQSAVLTATVLIDKYDDRQSIIDEINDIDDVDLRKKTMSEAMTQFSRKMQAEKEQSSSHYQTSIGMVNSGQTPVQISASNPEVWEGMTDIQRNNILSGKHMVTDYLFLSELRLMSDTEKSEINPSDIISRLNPSDFKAVVKEIENAKEGKPGTRVQGFAAKVNDVAQSFFGNKSKWRTSRGKITPRGEKANEFLKEMQLAVDEFERDKGGRITPAEENEMISRYTRSVISVRSRFGLDILASDIELSLDNTPAKDMTLINTIIDSSPEIDINDLTKAYEFLIDNDQQVTLGNLKSVYKQGRQ